MSQAERRGEDAQGAVERTPTPARDRTFAARYAWGIFVSVGGLFVVAYYTTSNSYAEMVIYEVVAVATPLAILTGTLIFRPARPLAWIMLAVSQFCFFVGDLGFDLGDTVAQIELPFPSYADVFYLAGYPFLIAALVLMVRSSHPKGDRPSLIDGAIIAVGVGVLAWMFLMVPYARDPELTHPERITSLAYPLMDVLILGVLARFLLMPRRVGSSYWLLSIGIVLTLVGDVWFAVVEIQEAYTTPHVLDVFFLASYLFIGGAALHPDMRRLTEPGSQYDAGTSMWRLLLLGGAALITPLVLAVQSARNGSIEAPVIAIASSMIFLLVLARLHSLMRDLSLEYELLSEQDKVLEKAVAELEQARIEREAMFEQVMHVAADERNRIAMELHDGPIQRLTALGFDLERARLHEENGDRDGDRMITQAQEWLAEEIRRLRLIMVELRPPALAEQGLDSALSGHVQAFEANAGLVCDYESSFHGRLAPAAEAVLFRVAQESLANIVKHARGATAVVRLNVRGDSVELEIRDDGVGFDVEELDRAVLDGHVGLAAVRERVEMIGGMLDLESRIGAGTIVRVRVPVTDGGSRLSSRGTPPDAPANAGDLPEVERTSHEEA